MGAGDVCSQVLVERKTVQQYEWKRTVRFFSLGTFLVVSVTAIVVSTKVKSGYNVKCIVLINSHTL